MRIEEVAKTAFSSRFHFCRMFFAMFDITPAEYIRKRKLTKAAADLVSGNERIIDIAVKYGYGSPNAFTRAFRGVHGVNPGKARAAQAKLVTFNPVSVQSGMSGGEMMEYRIVEKPEFNLLGKSKTFEFDDFVKNGAGFWKEYVASDEYKKLWELTNGRCGLVTEAPLMSAYFPTEDCTTATFTDVLGVEYAPGSDLRYLEGFTVPAATYAEFSCTYATSMKTNRYIYGEWFTSTGYERDGNKPDLAAYFPVPFRPLKEMLVRWWIPVVKVE